MLKIGVAGGRARGVQLRTKYHVHRRIGTSAECRAVSLEA